MLILNEEFLRSAYNMLCCVEPFNKWNLPDGEDVIFKVIKDASVYGWYLNDDGKHTIAVSESRCGHLMTVVATMAHEAIHLFQNTTCMETPGSFHNAAFKKLAQKVSALHGFDPKAF
jgi:hypothetical protein